MNNIFGYILEASLFSKAILLLLALCSVFTWMIIIQKWFQFKALAKKNKQFRSLFLQDYSLEEIELEAQTKSYSKSPCAKMFLAGQYELKKIHSATNSNIAMYLNQRGVASIERALQRDYDEIQLQVRSGLGLLATVASLAVFIGLLGTVWGIIDAFQGLAQGNITQGIEGIAPGISEALVATAVGLIAAIPAGFFFNYFSNLLKGFNTSLHSFSQDYLNLIDRTYI